MFKLFSKDSLHAQLEAERKAMENQQRLETEQARQAEQARIAVEQQTAEQTERAALDAVIAAATAAVDAFEQAAQTAISAEESVYMALYKDNCQLEQRLPAAFERERRMTLAKLRSRVQQILQRSQYEPTFMIGGGGAGLAIPAYASAAPAAPPSPTLTFSGKNWTTGEPIPSRE